MACQSPTLPNSLVEPVSSRVLRWTARGGVVVWTGFWGWFNVASMMGESDGFMHHLEVLGITLGLAVAAWFWPTIGGVLMVVGGLLAAAAFPNRAAFWLLAAPATAIGLLLLLSRIQWPPGTALKADRKEVDQQPAADH
jgi:hypothetical protein